MTALAAPAPRRTAAPRRIVAAALGAVSLLFLAVGSAGLYGELQKDDGYLSTGYHRFTTERSAIATDDLDIDAGGGGSFVSRDRYGKVRIQARGGSSKPLFVGIARSRDVDAFLGGTDHARLRDVDYSPFSASLADHPSSSAPGLPGGRKMWVASSAGAGAQTVTWDVRHGDWSVVVMNADGSPGVDVDARVGANLPILGEIAWTALGLGLALAAAAGGLLLFTRRG
jgi:hypothetical protein